MRALPGRGLHHNKPYSTQLRKVNTIKSTTCSPREQTSHHSCRFIAARCSFSPETNPLHELRRTKDPVARARLLQQLDNRWGEAAAAYEPTDVEKFLSSELGVWKETVMQLAIGKPDLTELSLTEQVRPSIKALKEANIAVEDIWFLVSGNHRLLAAPTTLQRWLDFLSAYGQQSQNKMSPRDVQNFLLRAPEGLLDTTTLYAAGQVVAFLKTLGISDDFLAQRVMCVWPAVLGRDVDTQLRPVVMFLMRLGIEVSDVSQIVCAWPDILLCEVATTLQPWADHLRTQLGCDTTQVAEVIMTSPHLLGFPAQDVFKNHTTSLARLGIGPEDMRQMNARSTRWLTSAGGIVQQVDFLLGPAGFTKDQARQVVLAAPGLLAEKEFDLERKWQWLQGTLGVTPADVMWCPQVMALGLMQVLGPRHGFLCQQGKLDQLERDPSQQSSSGTSAETAETVQSLAPIRSPAGLPALMRAIEESSQRDSQELSGMDLTRVTQGGKKLLALCFPRQDVEWCLSHGVSVMDYAKYRAHWEEEYTTGLVKSAAQEFQDELKKLGIYEGTD